MRLILAILALSIAAVRATNGDEQPEASSSAAPPLTDAERVEANHLILSSGKFGFDARHHPDADANGVIEGVPGKPQGKSTFLTPEHYRAREGGEPEPGDKKREFWGVRPADVAAVGLAAIPDAGTDWGDGKTAPPGHVTVAVPPGEKMHQDEVADALGKLQTDHAAKFKGDEKAKVAVAQAAANPETPAKQLSALPPPPTTAGCKRDGSFCLIGNRPKKVPVAKGSSTKAGPSKVTSPKVTKSKKPSRVKSSKGAHKVTKATGNKSLPKSITRARSGGKSPKHKGVKTPKASKAVKGQKASKHPKVKGGKATKGLKVSKAGARTVKGGKVTKGSRISKARVKGVKGAKSTKGPKAGKAGAKGVKGGKSTKGVKTNKTSKARKVGAKGVKGSKSTKGPKAGKAGVKGGKAKKGLKTSKAGAKGAKGGKATKVSKGVKSTRGSKPGKAKQVKGSKAATGKKGGKKIITSKASGKQKSAAGKTANKGRASPKPILAKKVTKQATATKTRAPAKSSKKHARRDLMTNKPRMVYEAMAEYKRAMDELD